MQRLRVLININIMKYDMIIGKQGYIFPKLKAMARISIMSLSSVKPINIQRNDRIKNRAANGPDRYYK